MIFFNHHRLLYLSLLTLCAGAHAQAFSEMRPALLGKHPRSLVNLINTESLMKRGQGNAIVMFSCGVTKLGYGYGMMVYRGSPNSELLKKELLDCSGRAQFMPAIFNGTPTAVFLDGTASFAVVEGKPQLRIFLNQEEDALTKGHDFIAPQIAFPPGNPKFKGVRYPPSAPGVAGLVSLRMEVDLSGRVKSAQVTYEHPPRLGFGAVSGAIRDALFIPGFRNGKAVPCRFDFPLIWDGPGVSAKTG